MARLILLNKPYGILSQFGESKDGHPTLKDMIPYADVYPAGRLDLDSEGLLLLTDDGQLQHRISHPDKKLPKTYWVQVEGAISTEALKQLCTGVSLKDGVTRPAKVRQIPEPDISERQPRIRYRKNDVTSWIELIISEGKNRQVRRMTAAVGFPTLRLIRVKIGTWTLENLKPGEWRELVVNLPITSKTATNKKTYRHRANRKF